MLSLAEQVHSGRLVCPRTRTPLRFEGGALVSAAGDQIYRLENGVPILLVDPAANRQSLAAESGAMVAEYSRPSGRLRRLHSRLIETVGDQRSPASVAGFQSIFTGLADDALCISVGGGPRRVDHRLVNVNIGPFAQVDVVGDAYALPYADGAVDAIHCEAVLEHLEDPAAAVREMARVLATGRRVFAATPFLQAFHGYPDHFQNFTLSGHRRLFERAGLAVLEAAGCVGGAFALRDLGLNYLRTVLPGGTAGRILAFGLALPTLPLVWLDRLGHRRRDAAGIASTTYVVAEKPDPTK